MSWKATAFVKEIVAGITVHEKMVLFVLADYHNTTHKVAWPSIPTLAKEALMEERSVYRILERLEEKGFLERIVRSGKANGYRFCVLDTPDSASGVPLTGPLTPEAITPDPGDSAIRKERVEPVRSNGDAPLKLHPLQHAELVMEVLGMTKSFRNKTIIAEAIEAEAKYTGLTHEAVAAGLTRNAIRDREHGMSIDKFYFEDAKWRQYAAVKGNAVSASAARQQRVRESLVRAAIAFSAERT